MTRFVSKRYDSKENGMNGLPANGGLLASFFSEVVRLGPDWLRGFSAVLGEVVQLR